MPQHDRPVDLCGTPGFASNGSFRPLRQGLNSRLASNGPVHIPGMENSQAKTEFVAYPHERDGKPRQRLCRSLLDRLHGPNCSCFAAAWHLPLMAIVHLTGSLNRRGCRSNHFAPPDPQTVKGLSFLHLTDLHAAMGHELSHATVWQPSLLDLSPFYEKVRHTVTGSRRSQHWRSATPSPADKQSLLASDSVL